MKDYQFFDYNNIITNKSNHIGNEDDQNCYKPQLPLTTSPIIIMKPLQQEEIFAYFKSLSGAKRIELVCGLISMCIPLEIRFFDNVIQDMVKRDYNSFRDAEIKANTYQELDMVCKCDLLLEKVSTTTATTTDNQSYYDDGIINSTIPSVLTNSTEMQNGNITATSSSSSAISITSTSSQSNNRDSNTTTPTTNNNNNDNKNNDNGQLTNSNNTIVKSGDQSQTTTLTTTNQNISSNIASFPSRSKLIISLCLMQPSNSHCSTIVFNAIRKQLAHEIICQAVDQIYLPKNQNIDELFSEILLLLTMAMYHPAFTYEQRDLLASQKKDIEQLYYNFIHYIRAQQFLACQAAVAAVANQQAVPVPAQPMGVTVTGSNVTIPVPIVATSATVIPSGQQQSNYHPPATTPTNPSIGSGGSGSGGTNTNAQHQSSTQANASSAHIAHQYHHNYHQSGTSGGHKSHQHHHHHHNAGGGPTSASAVTHLGPQVAPVAAAAQQYIPFMPSPLGANITYTATGPPPIPTNATNAVIQNIAMLKMSSPQPAPQSSTQSQQQSSSPSPSSISPASSVSSNKLPPQPAVVQVMPQTATTTQIGQFIKLDSMYTTANLAGGPLIAAGPSPPTSLIVVDPNATTGTGVVPTGPTMCLHHAQLIVDDKSSITSSASCYNCGNMGHRGTECTTGTGDSSGDH
ncbi:hypothetical protein HUG17_10261 [Dermatophagoides farinae]|uniref:CCHC-type domain-containing protein n=1 Tax=Dermatophagoides farinae TaxID=6954 RepID=A0A9D4SC53_DERFA|nr:homeobox protein 5-like [Dermatophagoides farinae]KAH7636291.1 hypothetical protein HUG17_10261 [Dermatophagoides farinae]